MIARFSLWARVTCTDGRSSIAGPVAVVDALRAVRVLTPEMEPRVFVEHLLALPNGGLAVTTGSVASNDPSVTLDAVWVLAPDGSSLGCGNNCAALSLDQHTTGTPLPMHPWLEDTHAMVARGDHLRAWVDYVTGENHSALYYDSNPLPAAATSGSPPLPAGLRGWTGIWAPWPDGSGRVWVERNKSFALLDLDE